MEQKWLDTQILQKLHITEGQRPYLEGQKSHVYQPHLLTLSVSSKLASFPIKHTKEYAQAFCRLNILSQLPCSSVFLMLFVSFTCISTSLSPDSLSEECEPTGCSSQCTMWGTFSKFDLQKPPKASSLRCSTKWTQAQGLGYNIRDPFLKKTRDKKPPGHILK